MSLPTITPFVNPPDRAQEGSDFGTALTTWIGDLNTSVASLQAFADAFLAEGSTTPTADKIPIADASGFLDSWVRQGGECRLVYTNASTLTLGRFNGYRLIIDDKICVIPAAGITLSVTGLTELTLYYIYAYMDSGVMKLEASTTGYSVDSRNGIQRKMGDTTRTFVGMARTISGPAWVDSLQQRLVISYYNRQPKLARAELFNNIQVPSASTVSINTSLLEILSFQTVLFPFWSYSARNSDANTYNNIALTVNGSQAEGFPVLSQGANVITYRTGAQGLSVNVGYTYFGFTASSSAGTGYFDEGYLSLTVMG